MQQLLKYFPNLDNVQRQRFEQLNALYHEWNARINVISRKDIDQLYLHHVLHSLGIATFVTFRPGTQVMDLGTGGGFPGIPLAILFPEAHFHLVDSIGKKIKVCDAVVQALGLENVTTRHCRAQEEKGKFHFVVSRAVMPLSELVKVSAPHILKEQCCAIPNGLICLKGGELEHEVMPIRHKTTVTELSQVFAEKFFSTKKIVYVSL